jgi:hypothetical protein
LNMLIAILIFVTSLAATIQFAVFTWRIGLLRVATQTVPDSGLAAELSANLLTTNDFAAARAVQGLCPNIDSNPVPKLRSIRLYFSVLKIAERIGDFVVAPDAPGFGGWTNREMALCMRYATVVLSQRLERNRELCEAARAL